ncbi:hypothetical protein CJF31_00009658 [Rutstroemia sp. NJR-2017a BVV2]|nr:hypothetical protein CJF31_00009658 [Rutstroemia sp. NJR-2017a BVV2]
MVPLKLAQRQEVTTQLPVGSSFISFGAIIGIVIGVAMALIVGGVGIAIYNIRKTRKREALRAKGKDVEIGQNVAVMVRANPPSFLYPTFGSPYDSMPIRQVSTPSGFVESEDEDDNIIRPNTKRFSEQKSIFRKSGIRDSWPLASFNQMSTRQFPLQVVSSPKSLKQPPERNIRLNCVAPPGYVLPDEPQKPTRTFSRRAQAKNSDSVEDITIIDGEPTVSRGRTRQRSSSENQLSVILKSTSQRLRDTQRRSLGRFPGSLPKQRLPTPPVNNATESRELLIRPDTASSDVGSQHDKELFRTPSPGKKVPRTAGRAFQKRGRSPTPSGHSDDDSLCGIDTPDLVIPAQLTSPSKSGRKFEQRHLMNLSTSKIPAPKIHQAAKPSVGTIDKTDFGISPQILANDPFLSIKGAKPISSSQMYEPRPLHIRKATFGHHAAEEKPLAFIDSSLKDTSVNQAGALVKEPKSPTPFKEPNPFQWSPKEAMQVRTSSPSKIGPKRKGHKRSNIVRISGLPRPSSVSVVHEESEDDSSPRALRRIISRPTMRVVEKSPSCTSLSLGSRRSSAVRPPSSLTFNPILSIPTLIKPISPPDQGLEDYSPTLSVYNYYAENLNSEVEFFKHARSSLALKSQVKRHCKEIEEEEPDTPSDILVSFPPFSIKSDDDKDVQILADIPESPAQIPSSPPPIRPLALLRTAKANLSSPIHMPPPKPSSMQIPRLSTSNIFGPRPLSRISVNSNNNSTLSLPIKPLTLSLPAPPLLTIPTPVHLTGPRPEPRKLSSFTSTSSSTRDSIATSIGLLRRMNSEISNYSPSGMDSSPIDGAGSANGGSARGSKYYLSLGGLGTLGRINGNATATPITPASKTVNSPRNSSSRSPSPITKRASEVFERWRRDGGIDEGRRSREGSKSRVGSMRDSIGNGSRSSSPLAMGKHGLDVEKKRWSMTLLPDGGVEIVEDEGEGFWGGVLGQGHGMVLGRGREGEKIKERWGERWIGVAGEDKNRRGDGERWGVERDKENINLDGGREGEVLERPESLGLYDEYGFLKTSPSRGGEGAEFGVIGDGRKRMTEVRV